MYHSKEGSNMRSNTRTVVDNVTTITGTPASRTSSLEQLRRSVLTCILWEDGAYENGVAVATRIADLVKECTPSDVAQLAYEARWNMNLRHVPLYLMVQLAQARTLRAEWLTKVIGRVDEIAEFLSLYWKDGKCPISNQVKEGLRAAFDKFDAYQIAKYQGSDRSIKLRDVIRMLHPKPVTQERSQLYKKVIEGTLSAPDTWETALSGGGNKCEVFTRLINEGKLGSLAMLRNLRNMQQSGVSDVVIRNGLASMRTDRLLPFNFLTAVKHAPRFVPELEAAMFRYLTDMPKLSGKTVVIVDVSGSMGSVLSSKSELNRLSAASAIAMLIREVTKECVVYCTAGNDGSRIHQTEIVPSYRGFALRDAIENKARTLGFGGIFFKSAVEHVASLEKTADRVIVITDECDTSGTKYNPQETNVFSKRNYIINIAPHQNGVAYNKFNHINGFSESCIQYITAFESNFVN
jgi:60 kDa SS-A/Ro ribonucleoprotein